MQKAVTKCPKINFGYRGYQSPSLWDSGSDVTLIQQSYSNENLMHSVRAHFDDKLEVHTLFHLMVANDDQLPITKYVELDLNFMGHMGQGWNPSHKRSKPAPGPKTSDQVTRSSRMESGALSLQGVHKIIFNVSLWFM